MTLDSEIQGFDTTAKTISGAVNEVRAIAIGAAICYVFDTEASMEAWLEIPANVAILQAGNNLLIRELSVPDYWWDGTQALELEVKIDLTDYYDKSADLLLGAKEDITNKSSNVDTDKTSTTKYANVKAIYDWAVGKFIDLTKIVTRGQRPP